MRQLYEGFKKTVVAAGICICCLGLTACGKKEAQQAVEQETVQMQENETVGKQAADGADDLKNAEADKVQSMMQIHRAVPMQRLK